MNPRALLDNLEAGVAAIGPDWTIVEWSAAAARMTGLAADRVLGQTFWTAFPLAQTTQIERLLREVLTTGRPRTYILPAGAPDVPGLVLETRVTRGPDDHLVMLFEPMRVELRSESREAQLLSAFEVERRLYLQLFNSLPAPALLLNPDGQILAVNPEGAKLLGAADLAGARGRPLAAWVAEEHRPALATALHDAVAERQRLQLAIEVPGDSLREVQAVLVNVDPAVASPKLLFLAVDVSREMLLQRRLLQADRLAQLGALLSAVAHELNNPLAAIAAFAELLGANQSPVELKESADIILTEAMRAGRIIGTLLDFARQRPRMQGAVDLAEVVERALALQRGALKKAGVRVDWVVPSDLPAVMGDMQELQQVVLNVVVNARQAIESTGRPGQVTISARPSDGHVLVTVDDTGPGVPPEILDRVFEPFFTTRGEQGTGLGLAISFGLVRAMRGRMWIQNIEGGGARLAFELPADVGAVEVTAAAAAGTARAPRSLAVLVVEDEESVRRGMVLLAKRLGHQVTSVAGFDEATRVLSDPSTRYDAVLVDVHLNEAYSGFDVFDALRRERPGRERSVVFTTGDSLSARTRDQLEASGRPVLRKPFGLEELREMLDRVAGG